RGGGAGEPVRRVRGGDGTEADRRADHHRCRAAGEAHRAARARGPEPRMMPMREREDGTVGGTQVALIALVLIVLVALTFIANPYHLFQLTMVVTYACAVLGLTVLT